MSSSSEKSHFIKTKAQEMGFMYCGFSKAEKLTEEEDRLEQWLKSGMQGKMAYMENHFEKRLDPSKLVPGAKTVISLAYNYYTEQKQEDKTAPKISMYALGEDYHFVIKETLRELVSVIQEKYGDFNARVFVDSAPILERVWAKKSGLGWIGKNTLLINKQSGSYFFLAEIVCDIELEYDGPIKDYCGTCNKCIDACPTDAIEEPYWVNGSKCISYFTIELKDEIIPTEYKGKFDNWMFGCDICQEVCPWNSFSQSHQEPRFNPSERLMGMKQNEWQELTAEVFNELFKHSPVKRTKFSGLKRNIEFLKD